MEKKPKDDGETESCGFACMLGEGAYVSGRGEVVGPTTTVISNARLLLAFFPFGDFSPKIYFGRGSRDPGPFVAGPSRVVSLHCRVSRGEGV
jgi:hypothetical protein